MNLGAIVFRVFLFPGIVYAILAAWFVLWFERKLTARMQNRVGPPFYQPFYDFIKLVAKQSPYQPGLEGGVMLALPLLSVAALTGVLALLPVVTPGAGFAGDLILLVSLLEIPTVCIVLAGFVSRSLYGELGAVREATLSIVYNIPFLAGIVALASAAGSLDLSAVAQAPIGWVRAAAFMSILICLPAKLHINPFSLTNAEQEIYAGPLTEISGAQLALWELSHGLEWVGLSGLMSVLFIPRSGNAAIDILLFIGGSTIVCVLMAILSAGSARLKMAETVRIYLRWGTALAIIALIAGIWLGARG